MAFLQQINKVQIRPHVIDSSHIDITTVGKSLLTKISVGTGLSISSYTGADSGTGEVTLGLDSDLGAISALSTLGFVVRDTDNHFVTRDLAVSTNLTITNAGGLLDNPTIDLSDTGVTAGDYKYVSVDAKGRVTAGSNTLHTWVANEISVNSGNNLTYTIANVPVNGTLMVFVDGAKQIPGADKDYTFNESSKTITFTSTNLPIDVVSVCYFYNPTTGINTYDIQVETLSAFDSGLMRYRMSNIPEPTSVVVFLNGLKQNPGNTTDFIIDGQDVVFNSANLVDDIVSVMYFKL